MARRNAEVDMAGLKDDGGVPRRRFLEGAALVLGTAAAGAVAPAARAQEKITKEEAKYQDQPKGQQRCAICLQFSPPSSCKLVNGQIKPTGWCQFFAARENAH
jgi:hypothetical protein